MDRTPVVKLYRNPWPATLSDGVVLQILQTAALGAEERLQEMLHETWDEGKLEPGRDSFGAVLLDPTRPRSAVTFADRVFASIELGPDGRKYLPNGAAKADARDRHGIRNGELVDHANYCLGDGDFAWGNNGEYDYAIGGGSGLFPSQDGALVELILELVMTSVHKRRASWIAEQRHNGSHGWYNPANEPGIDYAAILTMEAITPAAS